MAYSSWWDVLDPMAKVEQAEDSHSIEVSMNLGDALYVELMDINIAATAGPHRASQRRVAALRREGATPRNAQFRRRTQRDSQAGRQPRHSATQRAARMK